MASESLATQVEELSVPEATKHRAFRWLAAFLQEIEIDALLHQNPIRFASSQDPAAQIEESRALLPNLTPLVVAPAVPLSGVLEDKAKEILARDQFQREYAAKAPVGFGMVRLDTLLTPQSLADMDYVRQLEDHVPPKGDLAAAFDFAFPSGELDEPAIIGNSVTFTSAAPNVFANPVPSYRRVPGGYEVVTRVEPRPNYLYVAQLPTFGGRLLVVNGVHHVLALLKKGRVDSPAVIRTASGIEELGLQKSTLFAHLGANRPPLIRDFLDPAAISVLRRQTALATVIVSQIAQTMFPAI